MPSPLFKKKEVKIDTLGEYLKSIREQLNFDLKSAAELAQIKPAYLAGLESGDYSALPSDVYIRGFLKSLATIYRVNEKVLVSQYEKERGLQRVVPIPVKPRYWGLLSLTPKTWIIAATALAALLAFGYIAIEIRSVLAAPFLEVSEPASDLTISGNSIVVSGAAEPGADVFINNQPVLIDSSGRFTENLLLSTGLNIIQITETNKFGKTSSITRRITTEPAQTSQPATAAVNLTVEIGPNSAWVYLEADGIVVERGTMLPGSTKTVTANESIILTSANAGSTTVILNDQNLGRLGREGEVIRNVEFNPAE